MASGTLSAPLKRINRTALWRRMAAISIVSALVGGVTLAEPSQVGPNPSPLSVNETLTFGVALERWFAPSSLPEERYAALEKLAETVFGARSTDDYRLLLWTIGDRLDRALTDRERDRGLHLLGHLQNLYIAENIDALTRLFSADASLRTQARVVALLGAFGGFVAFRNQLPSWMVENLQSRETYIKYLIGRLALTATVLDVSKPIRGERAIGRLSPVEVLKPRLGWVERYGMAPRTTIDHQEEVGTTTVVSTLLLTTAADALLSRAYLLARGTQISSPLAFVGSFVVADFVTKSLQPKIDEFYFSRAEDRLNQAVNRWQSSQNRLELLANEAEVARRGAELFGLASEPLWQEIASNTNRIKRFTACFHISVVPGPSVTRENSITPPIIDPQIQRQRALASWPFRFARLREEIQSQVRASVLSHRLRLVATRDRLLAVRDLLARDRRGRPAIGLSQLELWANILDSLNDPAGRSQDALNELVELETSASRLKVDRNLDGYLELARVFNCPSRNETIEFGVSSAGLTDLRTKSQSKQ